MPDQETRLPDILRRVILAALVVAWVLLLAKGLTDGPSFEESPDEIRARISAQIEAHKANRGAGS